MVVCGVLLIALGIGSIVYEYWLTRSPFDVLDSTSQDLDASDDFIPLIQEMPDVDPGEFSMYNDSEAGSARGCIPEYLSIPAIDLQAAIVSIPYKEILFEGEIYFQWLAPDYFAVGWHENSAFLGVPGNTVLNGHHNVFGGVFVNLYQLQVGDKIEVSSGDRIFKYHVTNNLLLPERYQPLETRLENARWILPSEDERLTLVTCWPAESNTHRVVIVAYPEGSRSNQGNGTCNKDYFHPAITPTPRLFILPSASRTSTASRGSDSLQVGQITVTPLPTQTPTEIQPTATATESPTETSNQ